MLAVAAIPFSAKQAFSQQEIDPDHFDHPAPAKAAAPAPRASLQHHRAHGHARLASNHAKQHRSHAA
jgi:hypothetical protein